MNGQKRPARVFIEELLTKHRIAPGTLKLIFGGFGAYYYMLDAADPESCWIDIAMLFEMRARL